MTNSNARNLGRMLRQQRLMRSLTLRELAELSGTSPSHLGRIEKGDRFPSAAVLRRLARPLAIEESELFLLAGYLSPASSGIEEKKAGYTGGQLDPYVREVLSREPLEVQRAVIGILSILKIIARGGEINGKEY
ncbi:MAG: helix-turn-helix domain-containing protein [Chloroflexi bacterium]|nr:helix-turn-helix domain-containing protein [Chloroflexota bacterium]